MKLTIDQIIKWNPCNSFPGERYSREGLKKLFHGDSIEIMQIFNLAIPTEDKFWVLLHKEILEEKLYLYLADCAEHSRDKEVAQAIRDYTIGKVSKNKLKSFSCYISYAVAHDSFNTIYAFIVRKDRKWRLDKLKEYINEM